MKNKFFINIIKFKFGICIQRKRIDMIDTPQGKYYSTPCKTHDKNCTLTKSGFDTDGDGNLNNVLYDFKRQDGKTDRTVIDRDNDQNPDSKMVFDYKENGNIDSITMYNYDITREHSMDYMRSYYDDDGNITSTQWSRFNEDAKLQINTLDKNGDGYFDEEDYITYNDDWSEILSIYVDSEFDNVIDTCLFDKTLEEDD